MSQDDPISVWITELRAANDDAATGLWNHFVQRLSESAKQMLAPCTKRVYDEDDAVVSAFNSVFQGITAGRYPHLNDRDSLWRVLLVVTSRKVTHRHRHDRQQKRKIYDTMFDSVFTNSADDAFGGGVQQLPCREPTPEFTAVFAETLEQLLIGLSDPKLQKVATLRLDGHTDSEIAARMGCARSTIQRHLEMIRRCWQHLDDRGKLD